MVIEMTKLEFKKWFPKQLREAREFARMTQTDLANKACFTQHWISHFECGRRLPTAYGVHRLQAALKSKLLP